mmetsp:Transcript_17108/g.21325  ORF Transcript_17108/g.21325 Transcript_17108/m.21325 type:complete len:161 (-) Transcript_17108:108-590(-)|eukprot:CAMPEP_0172500844 /NCGR_PEP_ID=MMETSP1066-20121228/143810_1 /TAXON_ID=671091 /ORGANISM="Coscinodiscus wailesii, Strain CCMP2513" /LENGTH=160 /DNA_ID=CAMNT_0013275315 /DNA_START=64 /DNA_END=546 /DNA_ORIENTATION=+
MARMITFRTIITVLALLSLITCPTLSEETENTCPNPEDDCANTDSKVVTPDDNATVKEPEDPSCPSRPHIVRCAAAHLDVDKNGRLERSELEAAIDALPWLSRGVLKIIGSVDKIMAKCDADRDGAISIDYDMDATTETCLASCFKKRAFKGAFFPDCEL